MKFRLGACAAVVLLAACSGQKSDSQMAALHGSAGGDVLKSQARAAMKPTGRDVRHSIANAPDRGALMAYQNQGKPVKREGAFTYYPVAMSEDHALKGVVTGHMTVPMPDGSEVKLNYERHDEGIDGNWTWVGRVEGGDPMQEAIITFGEEGVFASIPQGYGKPPMNIRTQGGRLYAVQTDPTKVKSPNIGHNDMAVPEASTLHDAMAGQILAANAQVSQNAVALAAPPSATNTIDVAVGYTAGFRNKAQLTHGAVTTALTYLLQIANQGFSNSSINGYLRLVNAQELSYTDTNTNQTALHELTGSNGSSNVAIPASLTPLRTARDQYGADVALLIRSFQQPEQQGCGIAWLIGANGATVNPAQDARWGYGVVSFGDDTGTDNQSYYCAPESMIHEVGHLLGSAHDQANSTTPGRYPYSYGYKSTTGNFYTIMAYGDEGQTPYRVFSNPALKTCGGNACGVANSADNARSMNQTIPIVTQFRATVVPFTGKIKNDIDNNGRSDLLWSNPGSSLYQHWLMNGATASSKGTYSISGVYDAIGAGDFNGDGRADVVWKHRTNGDVYIWERTATSYASKLVGKAPAGGVFVGTGDVDGDGKADMLWSQPASSRFVHWLMNGSTRLSEASFTVSSAYDAVGTGDFNGDGLADVVWKHRTTGGVVVWLRSGSGYSSNYVVTVPAGWTLLGTGDINDDNKADMLWHRPASSQFVHWVMNGARISSQKSLAISSVYDGIGSGDFNGDGRTDIVWRHRTTGQVYLWEKNSSNEGYTTRSVATVGGTWKLVR
ncbi:reprolysin-like metallopeptidase [Pseudoxanthomonas beigongshangi]